MTLAPRKSRKIFSLLCLLLGLVAASIISRYIQRAAAAGQDFESLPALQGQAAIDHLNERGLLPSLKALVDAERNQLRQPVSPDGLGYSIAISGDTAIIGAVQDDATRGAVYIFRRSQTKRGWELAKRLGAPEDQTDVGFGHAVALYHDTAIVAAFGADLQQGAVYFFERNRGGKDAWGLYKKLTAADAENASQGATIGSLTREISGSGFLSGLIPNEDPTRASQSLRETNESAQAAGPDPYKVYIREIKHGGSGCPNGSVSQSISNDRTAFTMIFDQYVASSGRGVPETEKRKHCQINIDLVVPNGWSFSIASVDYKGFVQLHAGVTAQQKSIYYLHGAVTQVNAGTNFPGPASKDYLVRDQVPLYTLILSRCNSVLPINVNTGVEITRASGASQAAAQITTDSIEGKIAHIAGLNWKGC